MILNSCVQVSASKKVDFSISSSLSSEQSSLCLHSSPISSCSYSAFSFFSSFSAESSKLSSSSFLIIVFNYPSLSFSLLQGSFLILSMLLSDCIYTASTFMSSVGYYASSFSFLIYFSRLSFSCSVGFFLLVISVMLFSHPFT